MYVQTILKDGIIEIPEMIRDQLYINEGDEIEFQVDKDKLILTKRIKPFDVFCNINQGSKKDISMVEIKAELFQKYEQD